MHPTRASFRVSSPSAIIVRFRITWPDYDKNQVIFSVCCYRREYLFCLWQLWECEGSLPILEAPNHRRVCKPDQVQWQAERIISNLTHSANYFRNDRRRRSRSNALFAVGESRLRPSNKSKWRKKIRWVSRNPPTRPWWMWDIYVIQRVRPVRCNRTFDIWQLTVRRPSCRNWREPAGSSNSGDSECTEDVDLDCMGELRSPDQVCFYPMSKKDGTTFVGVGGFAFFQIRIRSKISFEMSYMVMYYVCRNGLEAFCY